MSANQKASFLLNAAQLDGVSVSVEDEQYVVTCEEQSEGQIDTNKVHDVAEWANLRVTNTIADFNAGHVRVYVNRGDEA